MVEIKQLSSFLFNQKATKLQNQQFQKNEEEHKVTKANFKRKKKLSYDVCVKLFMKHCWEKQHPALSSKETEVLSDVSELARYVRFI